MTNLLYIGNQLSQKGKTVTTIDSLSQLLNQEGFNVATASIKKNKAFRLIDMVVHVVNHRKGVDYVLIDTYSTTNFYYAYIISQLCRIFNLKYIPILHGGNLPNRLEQSPKLSKAIFKHAYINVAPSLFTKSNFGRLGYHNVTCIPNAIELKNYPFKKRTFENVRLLWVRSFSKIYNPILAIDILKILKNENINAELCMVGPDSDGSLLEVKKYAKALNVEVTFTGKLSKQEWSKLSENYNIFINTTNVDNMPVSVIEAMALGLPVVSTNVGGVPFLIENNKNGILVEPKKADGFVRAIKQIMLNSNQVNQITENARGYVEQFDWEKVKEKWNSILS
jgi:glycosyltransferase involved in cell wall biosynthesis